MFRMIVIYIYDYILSSRKKFKYLNPSLEKVTELISLFVHYPHPCHTKLYTSLNLSR